MPKEKYSDELKKQLIEETDQYRKEGYNAEQAAKKAGIAYGQYNYWKMQLAVGMRRKKSNSPRTPEEWNALLDEYNERQESITIRDFCVEKGIPYQTFQSVLYRARHPAKQALKNPSMVRTVIPAHSNGVEEKVKLLTAENERLRILVVDYALDIQALKEYAGRR